MRRVSPSSLAPPPGPFRREHWRSPLRGRWLTAVFGAVLLTGIPWVIVTGLLSYAAYNPRLGSNDLTPTKGLLGFYLFDWPTQPSWLYRVTQGIHVIGGLTLVPVVLAKLWSVIPRLFAWPPVKTAAQALERATLLLLVGGILFELVTGILNVQYWYAFPFSFYSAHFYGAWVFIGAFVGHVAIKLPQLRRSLSSRSLRDELRTNLEHTWVEGDADEDELVPVDPASATISRRGALGVVGLGSFAVFAFTAGETLGGPLRQVALLAPRGRSYGDGPNDFQINKPAASVGVTAEMARGWQLELRGGAQDRTLSREELLGMDLRTYGLPIACVEGWSTHEDWTGVRLRDLAALAGAQGRPQVLVESLQKAGAFSRTTLSADQVAADKSLLALRVNGADLSLDHGFPARIIVPALPGVHNTKWVRRLTFQPTA